MLRGSLSSPSPRTENGFKRAEHHARRLQRERFNGDTARCNLRREWGLSTMRTCPRRPLAATLARGIGKQFRRRVRRHQELKTQRAEYCSAPTCAGPPQERDASKGALERPTHVCLRPKYGTAVDGANPSARNVIRRRGLVLNAKYTSTSGFSLLISLENRVQKPIVPAVATIGAATPIYHSCEVALQRCDSP